MIRRSGARSLNGAGRFSLEFSKRSYTLTATSRSRQQLYSGVGRSKHNTRINGTYNTHRTFLTSWFSEPKTSTDSLPKEPVLANTQPASTPISQSSQPLPPSAEQTASALSSSQPPFPPTTLAAPTTPPSSSSPSIESSAIKTPLDDLIQPEQLQSLSIGQVVEEIGHLKSLGLDFGWGPTSTIQWLLEHVHVWSGTSWWASIILTALLVRLSLVKLFFKSADVAARQRALMPILQPIQEKIKVAKKNRDQEAIQQASQEIKQICKTAGFSPFTILLPTVLQGVLGFGTFRLLRGMAALPVPGLKNGGVAWFPDLTLPDPYYVLPALVAASMHMFVRIGGETGNHDLQTRFRPIMLYVLPSVSFIFMIWQPSALQVSFAAATAIAITQNSVLKNTKIREFLGITPLYKIESETVAAASKLTEGGGSPKEAAAAAIAAADKLKTPSSVRNISATPQYQPPSARAARRSGQRQRAVGRAFSSSLSSPLSVPATAAAATATTAATATATATATIDPETKAAPKTEGTWLFRTLMSAKNKVGASIEAGKTAIGLGGPPPDSENTTTNEVKTRGYLKDAAVYEEERQGYFRDLRTRKIERERREVEEKARREDEAEAEAMLEGRVPREMESDGDVVRRSNLEAGGAQTNMKKQKQVKKREDAEKSEIWN